MRTSRVAGLGLLPGFLLAGCATLVPRSRSPSPQATVVEGVPIRGFGADRCGPGSLSLLLNAYGDAVSEDELDRALPKTVSGGVLSVDLLLTARQRGFEASLVAGTAEAARKEIEAGRPAILMLKLLDAPGRRHDIYHYVVVDGHDPGRKLFRFQFGDGKARWASLAGLEKSWSGAGHALLVIRPKGDLSANLRRGVELEGSGRTEEAAAIYRHTLAAHPESVRAWVDLGNAEVRRQRRAEAEQAYRQALAIAPNDRDALNNLAWLLLEEGGRLAEAEELAAKAAREPGAEQPLAQDTLGRIWIAQGRCDEAARIFQDALVPRDGGSEEARAELLEGLGQAQRACGRLEEARAAFLAALRGGLEPSTKLAVEAALEALARPGRPGAPEEEVRQ